MKYIAILFLAIFTATALAVVAPPVAVAAESIDGCSGPNCLDPISARPNIPQDKILGIPDVTFYRVARRAIGVLAAAAAVLSTIFLVLGGIKYTSSNGNPSSVAAAKNTITYAIIGLIISIMAGAIVGFVLGSTPR